MKELQINPTNHWLSRYQSVRQATERLCDTLKTEDFNLQATAFTSPVKWHLAHTTWFFETFILKELVPTYTVFNSSFHHLFNSYYNSVGNPFARPNRGLLSRPTLNDVWEYRKYIDNVMAELSTEFTQTPEFEQRFALGLNHEQQHQELILTDIKYNFFQNPLFPSFYQPNKSIEANSSSTSRSLNNNSGKQWITFDKTESLLGHNEKGFCFDNELPQHTRTLTAFGMSNSLVTNDDWLQFMGDGGYSNPLLWLSDGWQWVQQNNINAPLYWLKKQHQWDHFTLSGLVPVEKAQPVRHISFYEADAFATWAGFRLPTEFEWEYYARECLKAEPHQANDLFGKVWQWSASSYSPYPGFKAAQGALGEYNGKFMCNQMVLRGSSQYTPDGHSRITYRNFFYPQDRWQLSGLRLAKDLT